MTTTTAHTCKGCGRPIEWSDSYNAWVDEGTNDLVYCNDQDETQDGQRHEVAHDPACPACGEQIRKARDGWVHFTGSIWCSTDPAAGSCVMGPR